MKLSDQVISYEQAVSLKELGVDGDSLFVWQKTGWAGEWEATFPSDSSRQYKLCGNAVEWIPAWTVAELSLALGNYYPSWPFSVPGQDKSLWIATVICGPRPPGIDDLHTAHEFDRFGETQALALGTLLIAV
jgi:hypothetical protein